MKALRLALAIALAGALAPAAIAQDCGCEAVGPACCSNPCGSRKVCRLVKTTELVTVVCWGCKDKDICIPCRSCKGCDHEELVKCGNCDCCSGEEAGGCCIRWTDWTPTGAKHKTVKELVKYEVTKEICVYRWEVVDVCGCAVDCGCASAQAGNKNKVASLPK